MAEFKFFGSTYKRIFAERLSLPLGPHLSLSHHPHTSRSTLQPHIKNSMASMLLSLTVTFPAVVAPASRTRSLDPFDAISCDRTIFEIRLQQNVGYFFTFFSAHQWVLRVEGPHLIHLCSFVVSALIRWALSLSNKRVNEQHTPKEIMEAFVFPFHMNFTSWEAQEDFLHPLWNYCLNWHSFLCVQWKSQIRMVCVNENCLFFQNKQTKHFFVCLGRNWFSLNKYPVYK